MEGFMEGFMRGRGEIFEAVSDKIANISKL